MYLLNYEVFVQELGKHIFCELTPELCHEVAGGQRLWHFLLRVILPDRCQAEYIIMRDANLLIKVKN